VPVHRTIRNLARHSASPARHARVTALTTIGLFGGASEVLAHQAPLDRRVDWLDWNDDPVVWLSLLLAGWLYARGLTAMWERASVGQVIGARQALAFAGGWIALAVAILSPLDPLSDQLAWAHMVQHMILMTVAAPLIVAGAPLLVMLWGLPLGQRKTYGRLRRLLDDWHFPWTLLWNPLVVWTLHAAVMWIWHLPALYQAALRYPPIHDLQHFTFFVAACLFWRVLLDPLSRLRLDGGVGVMYLFTTTLHATVLGVFMTIAPTPWYADYEGRTELWGLTALEDQQLAGLIMWMPACAAYALVAIVLLVKTLQSTAAEPLPSTLPKLGIR
jgi:putative membrane protein